MQSFQIDGLAAEKRELLEGLTASLAQIEGVQAVVLGGSTARGLQTPTSDLDVGIYYGEERPFAIEAVRQVAQAAAAPGTDPVVTDFYGWGAWVNGGAWVHTRLGKVDLLYRNLDQVRRAISEAQRGVIHLDFNQQPPYGFHSVIYLTETSICLPLYDPHGLIAGLKELVREYPPLLKQKISADGLWLAEFTLLHARGFSAKGDVYNTVGCLTRTAAYLTQVLFAQNERYFISDKTAMAEIAAFERAPAGYPAALASILARPGQDAASLSASTQALHDLWSQVAGLVEGYAARW